MRILLTGSSGLVGSSLRRFLAGERHEVVRLVRFAAAPSATEIFWNPDAGILEPRRLEGFDAMVHLAGDNLAEGRWTAVKKARIRESRIQSTRLLTESIAQLSHPPQVLASASAVGFYGHRADERLPEQSAPGSGFLATVCQEWEEATKPAAVKGIRVVLMRFGIVLSLDGGALAKMLPVFRLGLGGVVGSGEQYWSWLTIDDAVRAIEHVLATPKLSGPVNFVSPHPVTNREFTKTLGEVIARPTILPVPGFVARLALGPMAEETLLASQRAEPAALAASGFEFRQPELTGALRDLLRGREGQGRGVRDALGGERAR